MCTFPLIPGQAGLATRAQLLAAGWTESAIRHLMEAYGRRVLPTVYAPHRGDLSSEAQIVAAALWAGPGAPLTGAHALARHGVPMSWTPGVPLFLVPKSHTARARLEARTVRSNRTPPSRTLGGIRVVSLERALTDAGLFSETTSARLREATLAALQCRMTTPPRVQAELANCRRNGSSGVRYGLDDYLDGLWSVAEARLAELLQTHRPGLEFMPNPGILAPDGSLVGHPDAYLPASAVVIQVHSQTYHDGFRDDGTDAWAATVEADSLYSAHGIMPVGVAPTTLRDQPERFLRRLDAIVAARRDLPPPDVTVIPNPHEAAGRRRPSKRRA